MNKVALLFGVLLIALGLFGYLGAGSKSNAPSATSATPSEGVQAVPTKRSATALIPAAFGLLLAICGALGLRPEWRKNSMHAAAGIALLGAVLGGGRFLPKLPALLRGDPEINQRAILFTGLLALICAIYLVLSIRSFVAARRSREAKST